MQSFIKITKRSKEVIERYLPFVSLAVVGLAAGSTSRLCGQYMIVNANSGLVLDVTASSTSNGAIVQQWDWLGNGNQMWNIVPLGNGYNLIQSVNSGKVLDVTGVSTANGAVIQQYDWLGGANQQWQIVPLGNGYNEIVNLNSGKVLDMTLASTVDGGVLQQYDWLGGTNQQWELIGGDNTGAGIPIPPDPPPMPPDTDPNDSQSCSVCYQYCGGSCVDNYTCPIGETFVCESDFGTSWPDCVSPSPIVLDPFENGFHFTDPPHGVKFRVKANGPLVQMSWPQESSRNGWLALDRNGNGTIDDFTELFGNLTAQGPSSERNGYRALAVFDEPANGGNGNGVIDPGDSVYRNLRVWIDANHNGISEPSELHSLPELGIYRIGLKYWPSKYVDSNGNEFSYKSRVWDADGNARDLSYDVFVAIDATAPVGAQHK